MIVEKIDKEYVTMQYRTLNCVVCGNPVIATIGGHVHTRGSNEVVTASFCEKHRRHAITDGAYIYPSSCEHAYQGCYGYHKKFMGVGERFGPKAKK